jgi:hypothetical protein
MSIFKVCYADEHRTHEELLQSMTLAGSIVNCRKASNKSPAAGLVKCRLLSSLRIMGEAREEYVSMLKTLREKD